MLNYHVLKFFQEDPFSPVKKCVNASDSEDSPVKLTKSKSGRRRGLAARLKKAESEEIKEVSDHAAVYSTKVSKFFGSGSLSLTSIIKQGIVWSLLLSQLHIMTSII